MSQTANFRHPVLKEKTLNCSGMGLAIYYIYIAIIIHFSYIGYRNLYILHTIYM